MRAAVVGALLTTLALAAPDLVAAGPAAEDRLAAFARGDGRAAAEHWRAEAALGSAEAKLGLGLLNDLGLGVPRNAAEALRWYRDAADDGLAVAQFNVAVMLDGGTAGPRDLLAAAAWYARAAANGHHRAQYNLGLLYAAGEGVPRNADLARHWLGRAAEALPAAAQRLATLIPPAAAERMIARPGDLAGAVVGGDGAPRAELAWSALPAPAGARFLVEIARVPDDGSPAAIVVSAATDASAHVATLPEPVAATAWRVSLVDGRAARYAASPWRTLAGAADRGPVAPSARRVTLRLTAWDDRARWLADELAASFAGAGLWVRTESTFDALAESGVRYAYHDDAELAQAVAEFLPALAAEDAVLMPGAGAAPGEIVVTLVGGPAKPAWPRQLAAASHLRCGAGC